MSFDSLLQRATRRSPCPIFRVLLATVVLALAGCADQSVAPGGANMAFLSMGATLPEGAGSQLGLIDAWRVQVIRPGEGMVAEDAGPVSPDEQSVTVSLSVILRAACEQLTIVIELSSVGEVWFRSERSNEVCVGAGNRIQAQDLQWVGPVIGLSSTSLSFSLTEGGSPQTQLLTVSNQGGGTLNWSASEDRWWLGISPASGSLGAGQSADISVTVSDLDLTGGQYLGGITVSDPNAINSPHTASVTLDYVLKPRIGLSAGNLSFVAQEGTNPLPQNLTVTNTGGGTSNWMATENAGWLALSPVSGSLGPGQSQVSTVVVSSASLEPGIYQSTITVADPNAINSPRTVSVSLQVMPGPRIGINPAALSFATLQGQNPASQTFTVTNVGGGTLNWSASDQAGWLSVSPASGSLGSGQSRVVTVTVVSSGLAPASYPAVITVTDPNALNSPATLPVNLTVNQGPLIGLSTTVLNFSMQRGIDPNPQQVTVSNAGGGVLEWQATDNAPWLALAPTSGTLGTVGGVGLAEFMTVSVFATDLNEGNYQALISISDPDAANSPRTILVNLQVLPPVAPVLGNLQVNLLQLNDSTCWNLGSRHEFTFNYSDPDGDILIAGDSLAGQPISIQWQFLPDGFSGSGPATAGVSGNNFTGTARFQLCIQYQVQSNTSVDISFSLMDSGNRVSNPLFTNIPRPLGANAPTQGSLGVSGSEGVLISRGGGG